MLMDRGRVDGVDLADDPDRLLGAARRSTEAVERRDGVDLGPGHQVTDPPFDHHPVVQRVLQLPGQFGGLVRRQGRVEERPYGAAEPGERRKLGAELTDARTDNPVALREIGAARRAVCITLRA